MPATSTSLSTTAGTGPGTVWVSSARIPTDSRRGGRHLPTTFAGYEDEIIQNIEAGNGDYGKRIIAYLEE